MKSSKADFTYKVIHAPGIRLLLIQDLDRGNRSVTNDIENVVADIAEKESIRPEEHYIAYQDSGGLWTRWNASEETFAPISATMAEVIAGAEIKNVVIWKSL